MKKTTLFILINLVSILCAADEPNSSHLDQEKALYEYLNGYENTNSLFHQALEVSNRLGLKCDDKYLIPIGEVNIIKPIQFKADQIWPISGLWKHQYIVRKCGQDLKLNLFVNIEEGRVQHLSAPLGDSIVPFNVINTALKFAYDVVEKELYRQGFTCSVEDFSKTAVVNNTLLISDVSKVISRTPSHFYTNKFYQATNPLFDCKLNINAEWMEEWQVHACKHEFKIKMKMILKEPDKLTIELIAPVQEYS